MNGEFNVTLMNSPPRDPVPTPGGAARRIVPVTMSTDGNIMKTLVIVMLALAATGCATMAPDPAGETVSQYLWHSPVRVISAPADDALIVRLHPKIAGRALVSPSQSRVTLLTMGDQQTQFLMDLERNKATYRAALVGAFAYQHMSCTPTSDNPMPTRFAIEFTYECAP